MPTVRNGREVLIEIVTLGTFAKVTAIDSATGTEVSLTGPANASRASLEAAAVSIGSDLSPYREETSPASDPSDATWISRSLATSSSFE